jgi:hypothetical protein
MGGTVSRRLPNVKLLLRDYIPAITEGIAMDEMAEAHAKDSRAERKLRDFADSIGVLLNDPDAGQRITPMEVMHLTDSQRGLRRIADHIVAVWN